MVCYSLNSNTRTGLVISLCLHCKSFDQSDPPECPQILDIYSVVVLQPFLDMLQDDNDSQ